MLFDPRLLPVPLENLFTLLSRITNLGTTELLYCDIVACKKKVCVLFATQPAPVSDSSLRLVITHRQKGAFVHPTLLGVHRREAPFIFIAHSRLPNTLLLVSFLRSPALLPLLMLLSPSSQVRSPLPRSYDDEFFWRSRTEVVLP